MPILNFNDATQSFAVNPTVDLSAVASAAEKQLFSKDAHHVIKGFVDPAVAERMKRYFIEQNPQAFRVEHSPLFTFHGHSLFINYPRGPYQMPSFYTSAYREISLLRNRIYANQKFYRDYCTAFGLPPADYEKVYDTQVYHTWSRVSWYKEHDGQCPHLDNYGEIAAFLFLTKKGVDWEKGGLYFYDKDGNRTLEVDALCEPGDLLFLDQNNVIHGVEPVLGAHPGRVLLYVPIIPQGYMAASYTFENDPWKLYFSRPRLSATQKFSAYLKNAATNIFSTPKVHYSRRAFLLKTQTLPAESKTQEKQTCVSSR